MRHSTIYRPDIDGLRAIAVILVVIFHAFPKLLPGGFLGVDIFFVISGYLITGILLNDLQKGQYSILNFYAKRFRRILPALFFVLISILALSYFVLPGDGFNHVGKHTVGGALFFSNFLFYRESGYFDSASDLKPLLHLWSLSVEEQFYLVWPLLVWALWRKPKVWKYIIVLLCCFSLGLSLYWAHSNKAFAFFSIFSRFWELSLGCGLAYFNFQKTKHSIPFSNALTFIAAGLVIASQLFTSGTSYVPGWGAIAVTVSTVVFIYLGNKSSVNRHILENKLLVAIGLISYPLYLWHWPVLATLRASSPSMASRNDIIIASLFLSALLAFLTRKLIELPIQRYFSFQNSNFLRRPVFAVGLGIFISVGLAAAGLFIFKKNVMSRDAKLNPVSHQLLKYAAYDTSAARLGTCFLDTSLPYTGFSKDCYSAIAAVSRKSALLLGDSLAAHLYPGLKTAFLKNKIELFQLNASSCPPIVNLPESAAPTCKTATRFILETINKAPPQIIILFANWVAHANTTNLPLQLIKSLNHYRSLGVSKIYVIGPTPQYTSPVYKILDSNYARKRIPFPSSLSVDLDQNVFRIDEELKTSLSKSAAKYLEVLSGLCTPSGCRTFAGADFASDLFIYDTDHLTSAGAKYVTETFIAPVIFK